jgi:NADH:ubiquinone oxidoreductase subunit F (NADH-binding)
MSARAGVRAGGAGPAAMPRPARLTAGWVQGRPGPADLGEHHGRYGPLSGLPWGGPDSLARAVTEAGLTGRGGAGFPTGTKLRAVAGRAGAGRGGRAAVVANGMESEPASRKDRALLDRAPHLVLDGAVLAARAVGADTAHVCLDRGRPRQVSGVRRAIAERERDGRDGIRLVAHELPGRYVSSEASALVRWLNGGDARPVLTPPRLAERGVGRRPTLVDNVETLAHIALIARFGPDWFRAGGQPGAPGTMLVTVGGAAADPGVYEVPGGVRTGDVLALAGADPGGVVLIGGYFGTWHDGRDVAGLPLSPAGLAPAGAAPGAGVLLALPDGACGIAETAAILGYLAGESAGQCGPCRFGLPAIAGDFAQLAQARLDDDQGAGPLGRLDRRLGVIAGRGACRLPDGAVRLAASALAAFGPDARAHAAGWPCAAAGRPTALPVPRPAGGMTGGWR